MTAPTEIPEETPADHTAPDPEAPAAEADEADTATEAADGSKLAAEARKWRKQYQQARGENEALAATVTGLQRQIVDNAIAGKVADLDDWWSAVDVADLLADDGTVDPGKIAAQLDNLLAAKPHWGKRPAPAAAPASEVTATTRIPATEKQATWADVIGRDRPERE